MRVFLLLSHSDLVPQFEPLVRAMSARGDTVYLLFQHERDDALLRQLQTQSKRVHYELAPRRDDRWVGLCDALGRAITHLRHTMPLHQDDLVESLRSRKTASRFIVRLIRRRVMRNTVLAILRTLNRAVPRSRAIDGYIARRKPDLVILTPVVDGSTLADWVRSAGALGRPTALHVASAEDFGSIELMHEVPDRIYVLDEFQRSQAVALHRVPSERVVVVGRDAAILPLLLDGLTWLAARGRVPSKTSSVHRILRALLAPLAVLFRRGAEPPTSGRVQAHGDEAKSPPSHPRLRGTKSHPDQGKPTAVKAKKARVAKEKPRHEGEAMRQPKRPKPVKVRTQDTARTDKRTVSGKGYLADDSRFERGEATQGAALDDPKDLDNAVPRSE